jgi:hypothetical protein
VHGRHCPQKECLVERWVDVEGPCGHLDSLGRYNGVSGSGMTYLHNKIDWEKNPRSLVSIGNVAAAACLHLSAKVQFESKLWRHEMSRRGVPDPFESKCSV